jgi:DNA polymerase I-like protein with 3'-5' exonuclease and polymerase domains/5'-3' exonuclease
MTRLIVDGNSVLNAALLGGKDEEFGRKVLDANGKEVHVNGHLYGVDKFFDKISEALIEFDCAPRDIILVWDGQNAKNKRTSIFTGYKAGRDKLQEVSDELNLAREMCTRQMLGLGAHVASQKGYEADDVIAFFCETLNDERNVVITSDGDLTVLVNPNTSVWRLGKLDENPYGPFPHKYITLYKALVGDTSDKIPGAKWFGDAAWCELVRVFGLEGLDMMVELIKTNKLHTLAEDVGELKALQKIIDSSDQVRMSWALASLYPDDINAAHKVPMELKAGMVTQWDGHPEPVYQLKRFYGTKTLVTAANYRAIYERLAARRFSDSPFVSLDIETSQTDESDEWVENLKRETESSRERLDVLGHELSGMSLTFGHNTQHTIYMSVDHKDTDNITVDQCREMVELIPQEKHVVIQNRSFEFSVLWRTWGDKWADNGWYGFIPNAIDTTVGASYCDENLSKGLKQRSLHHLGYEQTSYAQTTTKSGPVGSLSGGQVTRTYPKEHIPAVWTQKEVEVVDDDTGEITTQVVNDQLISKAEFVTWEDRQYRMNELTAAEVFDYGCDDTICTSALHTHYKLVMSMEGTWQVYLDVETLPQYLTSLAYVQGIPISRPRLAEMERSDQRAYDKAWELLRSFLMAKGWEGTYCPEFEGDIEPSDVKMCVEILTGEELTSKRRKLKALAADIRAQFPDDAKAEVLALVVETNNVGELNKLIKSNYTGEPKINFGSPKQMQHLFYNVIGIPPRIVNKLTDIQRKDAVMVEAFKKMRAAKKAGVNLFSSGPKTIEVLGEQSEGRGIPLRLDLTPDELKALISKASTDDTAVDTAIALDNLDDSTKAVLRAYRTIKEVQTRQNLFYKTYRAIPHWRDQRIHSNLNQAEAATRRYSSSSPNIQQLPSKGEGAKFREVLLAHHDNAVVVSLDFSGQELRLGAELSGDVAMTSCYVGDNKRDMHSLTAVAAAVQMWGEPVAYDTFQVMRKSPDGAIAGKAKKLRDDAKTVNFAAQYGAMAEKIAETMMCEVDVAQAFLDARSEAFPGVQVWTDKVIALAHEKGFAETMMGARRHLREALGSDNQWDRMSAERQVGNFWIQGSAAEMSKLAMCRVWNSGIVTGKYDAVFYCPIHDELVFSVHRNHAVAFIVEAHACMVAQYSTMTIPLESSIAIGRTFACEIEVGTVPDRALIEKAVLECFV